MNDEFDVNESDALFDPPAAQDGPGLFDEPESQTGPGLFDLPAPVEKPKRKRAAKKTAPTAKAESAPAQTATAEPAVVVEQVAEPQSSKPADELISESAPDPGNLTPAAADLPAPQIERPPRVVDTAPTAPLALYRRYRPDAFSQLIGQDHVTEPLRQALINNRVNHAYLFSGPRGCGKTTSARILARCLNCVQGPTPEPCGECQSCRDLARGGPGSIDVIEIDAASHGGVDDARELREKAFFAPVHSRYKIYIVDEAHMVTAAGFNALLKLVEEPPPHVKFIFATTEPEKVIGTIRSRTHHYPFRLVPPKTLANYLQELCDQEDVAVEPGVLPLVVRAGAGSVRDSLSVLDQLLGGAAKSGVTVSQASALLGYTPDALLDRIVDAFAAGDSAGVFQAVDQVVEVGQDPRRFAEDLLRRLRDLVIVAAVADATEIGLVDVAPDQAERLKTQANGMGLGELTRAAEVISAGITDMRGTTAPRLHLELMCARVLLPGADVTDRGIHARLDRLERRLSMAPVELSEVADIPTAPLQVAPVAAHPAPVVSPVPKPQQPAVSVRATTSTAPTSPAVTATEPVEDNTASTGQHAPAQPSPPFPPTPAVSPAPEPAAPTGTAARPTPTPSTTAGLSLAQIRNVWPQVLEEVKSRRRFTWIMLSQNAQVLDVRDGVLTLAMSNVGARDSWERGSMNADMLQAALVAIAGFELRITAVVDGAATPSAPEPQRTSTPAPPITPPPMAMQKARENIKPTLAAPVEPASTDDDVEPDFDPDDPAMNIAPESSEELLRNSLGAQEIPDEG